MENESPSSSRAGNSRWGTALYAAFAILALTLAVVALVAMVLKFGH